MANNTAKSVTLKDKNTNEFLYPYTSDSLVKRTNSTYETVKEALDALEAGGAGGSCDVLVTSKSDFTSSNIIYGIKDDIDLGNSTVDIPNDCVLKFIGGSLRNGTLSLGNGITIEAPDTKIFYNMHFVSPQNTYGQQLTTSEQWFKIDWFVENYATNIDSSQPDATAEIQAMFSSGVKKVYLTNNHHYRLTSTVSVDAGIVIDGKFQHNYFNEKDKFIFGDFDAPLIKIVAPSTTQFGSTTFGCTVSNMYLYRNPIDDKDPTTNLKYLNPLNEFKREIGTLAVDCTHGSLTGLCLKVYLYLARTHCNMTAQNKTDVVSTQVCSYRGIDILAGNTSSDCHCYNIHISGYINNYYEGIHVDKVANAAATPITYFESDFDSQCAFGGYICAGGRIGGQHQVLASVFWSNDDGSIAGSSTNGDAYFRVKGTCNFTGWVVDTQMNKSNPDKKVPSAFYAVRADSFATTGIQDKCIADNVRTLNITAHPSNFMPMGFANLWANIIPAAFYGKNQNGTGSSIVNQLSGIVFKVFETDADYTAYIGGDTTKGTDITEENTTNYKYLFLPDKVTYDNTTNNTLRSELNLSYVNNISTKVVYFSCTPHNLRGGTIVVFYYSSDISSVTISNGVKEHTFGGGRAYYSPIYFPLADGFNNKVSVTITYKTAVTMHDIPYIGICTPGVGSMIGPWGGRIAGDLTVKNLTVTGEFSQSSSDSGPSNLVSINGPGNVPFTYLAHPAMARRIGDGSAGHTFVAAHIRFPHNTANNVRDCGTIKIKNRKYGSSFYPSETCIDFGGTGSVVLSGTRTGETGQLTNVQTINVYRRTVVVGTDSNNNDISDVEFLVTCNNYMRGSIIYADSSQGIIIYDDIKDNGSPVDTETGIEGVTFDSNNSASVQSNVWTQCTVINNTTISGATTQTT